MLPGELRGLLLHPETSAAARTKVRADLVYRVRAGDPAWVIGLVGVAMPGLRRAASSLSTSWRGNTEACSRDPDWVPCRAVRPRPRRPGPGAAGVAAVLGLS
jgi:hypothetical protein